MKLRLFNQSDASRIVDLLEDGEVSKTTSNIPHPYTQKDAENWISRSLCDSASRFPFAIEVNHELVGCVSHWAEGSATEIGYWVGRNYQGKGICTKAVQLLIKEPSFPLANKIIAKVMLGNIASEKLLMKLGFNHTENGFISRKGNRVECRFFEKHI